jgi:YYY domain-containing protein
MIDFLKWYLLLEVMGWVTLPVTWSFFQKLRSRGVYLSKAIGLLLWGFIYWWLTSLGLLKNDLAGALAVLSVLLVLNIFVTWKIGFLTLRDWVRENRKTIVTTEAVFFVAFAFWALVRAANPDIIHTEKFMEMAFINGILKSASMPPLDPWLSGYSISYYYFGYLISALLIRVSGVASSVGYNLVSASWFGLTALGAYGVAWDLLSGKKENEKVAQEVSNRTYSLALLAPLMILIVSNWFGILDVLHARGLVSPDFWQKLQIPSLMSEPYSLSWFPNRGGWSWWQASRVVQDFRLGSSMIEIIDEFPFFTYLLADIHPHLLGMPFVLLAIAQALNAFQGGWEGSLSALGRIIPINWKNGLLAVLTLGGIAFLNTWDFPFYLLLLAVAFVWRQASLSGWDEKRIGQIVIFCLVGGLLSILAYLPFYLSFSSQAGGLLPSLAFFTHGIYLWIMFGPLLVPIFAWLVYQHIRAKRMPSLQALLVTSSLFALLFVAGWGLGWLAGRFENLGPLLNSLQGAVDNGSLLTESLLERLKHPGTFLTMFFLVLLAVDFFVHKVRNSTASVASGNVELTDQKNFTTETYGFVLMLVLLGALLVIVPEFVYLRDQFGTRMNTIFKFYFQAWILWSLASAYFIARLLQTEKPQTNRLFALTIIAVGLLLLGLSLTQQNDSYQPGFGSHPLDYLYLIIPLLFLIWVLISLIKKKFVAALGVVCLVGLAAGLVFPTIELWNKTEGFQPRDGYSLNGKQDFYQYSPDQMAAAEWLADAPLGVMAEAVSETGGSYTTYNIISTFSGMPTILGWIGHESQWRGGYEEIGSRQSDLRVLYSTSDWSQAQTVIDLYNIRYVVVGELERQTYQVDETKFEENMNKVLDTATVDIYEAKNP